MSMPPPNANVRAARGLAPPAAAPASNNLIPNKQTIRGGGPGRLQGGTKAGERAKVVLKPGRSPLDWAALRSSGKNLRGVESPMPLRITKEELSKHKTKEDCWTALRGRVYNLSAYMEFHPGGEPELMRAAGRDSTRLFELTHAWVNFEHMLDKCLVGFLID